MSTLKLGIIGAGFIAHFQARALTQVRNIEVAGISSLMNAESLSGFVKQNHLGEGTIYPNVGELAKHVEALAIFVPNFAKVETVEAIVEAVK